MKISLSEKGQCQNCGDDSPMIDLHDNGGFCNYCLEAEKEEKTCRDCQEDFDAGEVQYGLCYECYQKRQELKMKYGEA